MEISKLVVRPSGKEKESCYLLGVVVIISVIGLRAEYSAVVHGQFLRTTL